eukprot:1235648-Pyramimonas_sp.AAC.1
MSVILAHAKGRSSTPAMDFQCRLASATALAVGLKLYDRWVPSELNALDAASRVQRPRHGGKAEVAVHVRHRLPGASAVAACGPVRLRRRGRCGPGLLQQPLRQRADDGPRPRERRSLWAERPWGLPAHPLWWAAAG